MGAEILPFTSAYPACPKSLKADGKSIWTKGKDLWNTGVLTDRDLDAWQMYCEAFDEIAHCDAVVLRDGEYTISSQGTFSEHPALKRRRAAEQKTLRYQKLFGLVPDSRKKKPSVQQGVASRKR